MGHPQGSRVREPKISLLAPYCDHFDMGPVGHAVISGAVGVGAATGSPAAGGLALGVGVLMDSDHLYDFYQWYIRGKSNRIYILFHAWEYSAVGIIALASLFFHPLVLAVVLAHLAHVATDHFHNRLPRFAYFIVYRILKRFETKFITPGYNVMNSYQTWPLLIPFGKALLPWFRRRIEPWFEARVQRASGTAASVYHSDD